MTDRISLTGLRVMATHGVLPEEKTNPQPFAVDLQLWLDTSAAASEDDLEQTVDYGALANKTHRLVESNSFDLIETLAERIADMVLDETNVRTVEVTVHKPEAPIDLPFDDVSVSIRRDR